MTYDDFCQTLTRSSPPELLSEVLKALWFDGKGDWEKAHRIAQDVNTADGAWVHAYLHRKEGDEWNAGFWYRHANKNMPSVALQEEWKMMVKYFLGR